MLYGHVSSLNEFHVVDRLNSYGHRLLLSKGGYNVNKSYCVDIQLAKK